MDLKAMFPFKSYKLDQIKSNKQNEDKLTEFSIKRKKYIDRVWLKTS